MFVCSCFGITEEQVREHASAGRCTPRQIASECKAGTDCGSCVRRIQALLGRGAGCARRELLEQRPAGVGEVTAAGEHAVAAVENAVTVESPAAVEAAVPVAVPRMDEAA